MLKWQTKNGYKINRVLSGRSNAYLIEKENSTILVDTGKKSAFITLSRNIASLNLSVSDISFLILTHSHFDHCQSARKIKEISDCKVIVSGLAANSIKNGFSKLVQGTFPITKLIARLGGLIGKRKFGFEPFQANIFVQGIFEIKLDYSAVSIIETPGHSADSVSIIVDNEIAIVGDVMFGVFKNSVFPPYADNIITMVESWGRLLNTGCSIFLPGHGKEIKRELLQKEYDKYIRKYNN